MTQNNGGEQSVDLSKDPVELKQIHEIDGNEQSVDLSKDPVELKQIHEIKREQEHVRANTAYIAVGIFGLTVFLSLVVVALDYGAWDHFKELLNLLLPAETALTGSALAFYFGTKNKNNQ